MSLVVTSIGMVSAVGRSAPSACAAIRAGLSLPRRIRGAKIMDQETQELMGVLGHPVHGYTEGFILVGRWLRLARGCLQDLLRQGKLPDAADFRFWQQTALIAVTPYLRDERFMTEEDDDCAGGFRESFLAPLHRALGLPMRLESWEVIDKGHAGTAAAVARARSRIERGSVQRVIVVAVDSYLDDLSIEWLATKGRLKTGVNPIGVTPGEAGACLLLESSAAADARGARKAMIVAAAASSSEPEASSADGAYRAAGLPRAVETALDAAGADVPFGGQIVSDHNGEVWRAQELAYLRTALSRRISERPSILFPAESLGDTGAASGAIGACFSAYSFARGFTASPHSLVISSTERGDVGAMILSKSM